MFRSLVLGQENTVRMFGGLNGWVKVRSELLLGSYWWWSADRGRMFHS